MKSFIKYVSTVSDWAGRVAGWMIPILMIIVAYDVVKRYVFNAATSWAFDFSWMLYGASFILGGAYVLFHKSHIRVDVILNRFAPQTKGILELVFMAVLLLPLSVVLTWSGINAAIRSWTLKELSEYAVFHTPLYPIKTIVPIAFFLLGLQIIVEFIHQLQSLLRRGQP